MDVFINNGNLKIMSLPGSNTTNKPYFTRGSHSDDVLRLQGTPSRLERYVHTGKEQWSYDCRVYGAVCGCRITIDIDSQQVLASSGCHGSSRRSPFFE